MADLYVDSNSDFWGQSDLANLDSEKMSCFSNFNPETEDPLGGWVGRWAIMALIKKHEAFLRHYKPFKKILDNPLQSHSANL